MGIGSNLYDDAAEDYAKFRPSYPKELFDLIYDYLGQHSERGVVLDVATGSGQAAITLADRFEKVVAIDPSKEQLSHALKTDKVEFRQASAEATGMPDQSVDLITVATALHWFDLDKFFAEAHRVLKPLGTIAAWSYFLPTVPDNQEATLLIRDFANSKDILGPYWKANRKHLDDEYRSIHPPEQSFQEIQRTKVPVCTSWTVKQLIGWMSTWSAFPLYQKANADQKDPRLKFEERFKAACKIQDATTTLQLSWPIFVILARSSTRA